jgi:hypothetical protein
MSLLNEITNFTPNGVNVVKVFDLEPITDDNKNQWNKEIKKLARCVSDGNKEHCEWIIEKFTRLSPQEENAQQVAIDEKLNKLTEEQLVLINETVVENNKPKAEQDTRKIENLNGKINIINKKINNLRGLQRKLINYNTGRVYIFKDKSSKIIGGVSLRRSLNTDNFENIPVPKSCSDLCAVPIAWTSLKKRYPDGRITEEDEMCSTTNELNFTNTDIKQGFFICARPGKEYLFQIGFLKLMENLGNFIIFKNEYIFNAYESEQGYELMNSIGTYLVHPKIVYKKMEVYEQISVPLSKLKVSLPVNSDYLYLGHEQSDIEKVRNLIMTPEIIQFYVENPCLVTSEVRQALRCLSVCYGIAKRKTGIFGTLDIDFTKYINTDDVVNNLDIDFTEFLTEIFKSKKMKSIVKERYQQKIGYTKRFWDLDYETEKKEMKQEFYRLFAKFKGLNDAAGYQKIKDNPQLLEDIMMINFNFNFFTLPQNDSYLYNNMITNVLETKKTNICFLTKEDNNYDLSAVNCIIYFIFSILNNENNIFDILALFNIFANYKILYKIIIRIFLLNNFECTNNSIKLTDIISRETIQKVFGDSADPIEIMYKLLGDRAGGLINNNNQLISCLTELDSANYQENRRYNNNFNCNNLQLYNTSTIPKSKILYNKLLPNAKAFIVKDKKNHYTCYREENNKWFLYDDSKKEFEAIDNINNVISTFTAENKQIVLQYAKP